VPAGKNPPVFSVLTHADLFRFFAIDTDNVVYDSKPSVSRGDANFNSSTGLAEILRWVFTWRMISIKPISTRAARNELTEAAIDCLPCPAQNQFFSNSACKVNFIDPRTIGMKLNYVFGNAGGFNSMT
jgi:hypothetical protein